MPKYEIMVILDPKAESSVLENLFSTVFGNQAAKKLQKLELTNLAYPIKKSLTGQYFLANLLIQTDLIDEFIRRANITKTVWRYLIINLDSEKGFGKKPKPRMNRVWKPGLKRENGDRQYFQNSKFNKQNIENLAVDATQQIDFSSIEKNFETNNNHNNFRRANSQQNFSRSKAGFANQDSFENGKKVAKKGFRSENDVQKFVENRDK
ncbi:30S ribosomal protein S6 [Mycoplasma sp. 'Moose RK']|uniref:30S ribosomal protein S6 n=1 Tax=Mycoplasma sp. 'Moose RK' TaxID=2780095 RepID=UPI0018C209B5|nr:30S ribosomal protein S6 [Mycoplasma sp. 'Moose RK']MBG0730687.1 30S ribosomal protein S6 [Mycoplasma sp. 'Moose RK']